MYNIKELIMSNRITKGNVNDMELHYGRNVVSIDKDTVTLIRPGHCDLRFFIDNFPKREKQDIKKVYKIFMSYEMEKVRKNKLNALLESLNDKV